MKNDIARWAPCRSIVGLHSPEDPLLPVTVREFAQAAGLKPFKVISDLMERGVFAALNQAMIEESVIAVGKKNGIDIEIVPPP